MSKGIIMTIEYLDPLTQLIGFLSFIGTIFVVFFIVLILLKAKQYNDKVLYAFALFLIGLNSPWYPSAFCYVYWLITKEVFIYEVYMIIGTIGTPLATISWFYIYTNLIAQKYKKKIFIILGILFLLYYILVFFIIFIPSWPRDALLGILINPFDSEYRGIVLIYSIFSFVVSDSTIFHFCYTSFKESESKQIRLNGIFFLISTVLYAIGAVIDGFIILDIVSLLIVRIIILLSGIVFYLGLIMPKWFKKLLKIDIKI